MTAHWGIQDPAAVEGPEEVQQRAFNKAFLELDARIKIFMSLRLESIDKMALQRQLDAIGEMRADAGEMELFDGTRRTQPSGAVEREPAELLVAPPRVPSTDARTGVRPPSCRQSRTRMS